MTSLVAVFISRLANTKFLTGALSFARHVLVEYEEPSLLNMVCYAPFSEKIYMEQYPRQNSTSTLPYRRPHCKSKCVLTIQASTAGGDAGTRAAQSPKLV